MTTSAPIWAECPCDCCHSQELSIRWQRCWRATGCDHLHHRGDREAERPRPGSLHPGRARPPRKWPSHHPHQRTAALELQAKPPTRVAGLTHTTHGALSVAGGRVSLCWFVGTMAGEERLRVRWAELDGPPVQAPSMRRGFGTRLLERGLTGELQ